MPRWFIALLDIPDVGAAYPVTIGPDHVGDIFFEPDLSADVFEKWVGFLAIVLSGSTLVLLAALSAYFITGSAIRPLEQLATERAGQLKLVKVDVDKAPAISQRFTVQAVPTLLLLDHGQVLARQAGAAPVAALRNWLDQALSAGSGKDARS